MNSISLHPPNHHAHSVNVLFLVPKSWYVQNSKNPPGTACWSLDYSQTGHFSQRIPLGTTSCGCCSYFVWLLWLTCLGTRKLRSRWIEIFICIHRPLHPRIGEPPVVSGFSTTGSLLRAWEIESHLSVLGVAVLAAKRPKFFPLFWNS